MSRQTDVPDMNQRYPPVYPPPPAPRHPAATEWRNDASQYTTGSSSGHPPSNYPRYPHGGINPTTPPSYPSFPPPHYNYPQPRYPDGVRYDKSRQPHSTLPELNTHPHLPTTSNPPPSPLRHSSANTQPPFEHPHPHYAAPGGVPRGPLHYHHHHHPNEQQSDPHYAIANSDNYAMSSSSVYRRPLPQPEYPNTPPQVTGMPPSIISRFSAPLLPSTSHLAGTSSADPFLLKHQRRQGTGTLLMNGIFQRNTTTNNAVSVIQNNQPKNSMIKSQSTSANNTKKSEIRSDSPINPADAGGEGGGVSDVASTAKKNVARTKISETGVSTKNKKTGDTTNKGNNANVNNTAKEQQQPTSASEEQPPTRIIRRRRRSKSHRPQFFVPPRAYGPIFEPNDNDVLSGRGGRINMHRGNVQFREIVAKSKPAYLDEKTRKLEKAHIAAEIVYMIRAMDPPGRFLKEEQDGSWFDIGDQRAIRKVGQALREDAPDLRNDGEIGGGANNKDANNIEKTRGTRQKGSSIGSSNKSKKDCNKTDSGDDIENDSSSSSSTASSSSMSRSPEKQISVKVESGLSQLDKNNAKTVENVATEQQPIQKSSDLTTIQVVGWNHQHTTTRSSLAPAVQRGVVSGRGLSCSNNRARSTANSGATATNNANRSLEIPKPTVLAEVEMAPERNEPPNHTLPTSTPDVAFSSKSIAASVRKSTTNAPGVIDPTLSRTFVSASISDAALEATKDCNNSYEQTMLTEASNHSRWNPRRWFAFKKQAESEALVEQESFFGRTFHPPKVIERVGGDTGSMISGLSGMSAFSALTDQSNISGNGKVSLNRKDPRTPSISEHKPTGDLCTFVGHNRNNLVMNKSSNVALFYPLEGYSNFPEAPVYLEAVFKKRGQHNDDDMSWTGNHSLHSQQVLDRPGCYELESHGENDTMQNSIGRDVHDVHRMMTALSDHNFPNGNLNFAQQQYFTGNNSVTTMSMSMDLQSFNGNSSAVSEANSFSDLSSTLSNLEIDTAAGNGGTALRYNHSKSGRLPTSTPTSLADVGISTQISSTGQNDEITPRDIRPNSVYNDSSKSTRLEL